MGKFRSNQFDSLYGGPDMQRLGDYNHMQKPDILKQFFIVFQRIGLKKIIAYRDFERNEDIVLHQNHERRMSDEFQHLMNFLG